MKAKQLTPQLRFPEFDGEWEETTILSIADKVTDGTHDTPQTTIVGKPYLTAIHIKDGFIDYDNCYYLTDEDHIKIYNRCNPEKGDLLMVNIGAGTATTALVEVDFEFSLKNVALIKPNKKVVNPSFFSQSQRMNSARLKHQLSSGGAQPFLSLKQIGKLKLNIATLPEQQKIASFLTAIDTKLQQLTTKKELLEQYKKGVMQQLFSQQLRFKQDDGSDFGDWEEKKLGDYLVLRSKRNKDLKVKLVLSVNNKKGFISQSEQFDGYEVASKDLSNYKIVNRNDVAYNPSRINVGSIATLENFEEGIVSPMYVVFRIKKDLEIKYFENLYETHYFKHLIVIGCSGSVRDSLNFDDLCNFKISFPSLKEQQKIASFLSALDAKIETVQTQLEKTQQFKKGLLQGLFV